MKLIICKNAAAVGKATADLVVEDMKSKGEGYVLGLATGSTPLPLYGELIARFRAGEVDFSGVTTFNLDEYYPIAPNHEQSYYFFMWQNLFAHLNLGLRNTHLLNGLAADPAAECAAYEEKIQAAGGVDLQILGIGGNGHIAFNEPGSGPDSRTRMVELDKRTRKDNARFFEHNINLVPTHALSMGIGTILDARKNLLLATGQYKGEAITKSLFEPESSDVPASHLQRHADTVFLIDQECAQDVEAHLSSAGCPEGIEIERL